MLINVDEIKVEKDVSDEWGVYRIYKSGNQIRKFLLFSFTERQEALYYAGLIAGILPHVKFRGEHFDTPYDPSKDQEGENPSEIAAQKSSQPSTAQDAKPKPKRYPKVSGAGDIIKTLISNKATDEQIIQELLPLYESTGRPRNNAIETIKASIYTARSLYMIS